MNLISQDIGFMREACFCCDNSTCLTKTGCVLVLDGEIISKNWNYLPDGKTATTTDEEREIAIHSEAAAITEAKENNTELTNAVLYVTRFPCTQCAKLIKDAGIKEVFYMSDIFTTGNVAQSYFDENNIKVTQIHEAEVWKGYQKN